MKNAEAAKRKILKAVDTLNKVIVLGLKQGVYPEIAILGEADEWPEIVVEEWTEFPKHKEIDS